MKTLKEQYLNALKSSQKQLVSKSVSASPVNPGQFGPHVYAVRNNLGQVIGFGQGEPLSKSEIESLKSEVTKSAKLDTDKNAVFDDLFNFGGPSESAPVEVEKSANESNENLSGIFPKWLQPNFPNQ